MFDALQLRREDALRPTTFAEPGGNETLSAALFDSPVRTDVGTMFGFGGEGGDDIARVARVWRAADRVQQVVDNTYAREAAIEEAVDARIAAVKAATGVELQNYARVAPTTSTMAGFVEDAPAPSLRDEFHQQLADLAAKHPDQASAIRATVPIEEDARQIARQAETELRRVTSDPELGTGGSLLGSLGGGISGSFRDPLQVSTLFAGGGISTAATVTARLAQAAVREGLINAGAVALTQPSVQAWRAEAGLKSGVVPALENVGLAFLFGAIPGSLVQGGRELTGSAKASIERVLAGRPEPGDIEAAMAAARGAVAEIDRDMRAVRLGQEMTDADKAILPRAPADADPAVHDAMTAAALRHAEDPASPPPQAVAALKSIDAWHGSPHDFDRFDLSRVGTGEGAQSYGHGLYFAENAEVARSYQLSTTRGLTGAEFHAAAVWRHHRGDRAAAIEALVARERRGPGQGYAEAAEMLRSGWTPEGNVYRVRINADPERFLDWDKPLAEQAAPIRNALENHPDPSIAGTAAKWGAISMGDFYKRLASRIGEVEASEALRAAGIPGIKYLDQGSRSTGDGTRNYVVFDDKLLEITHKNDQPMPPQVQRIADAVQAAAPRTEREAQAVAHDMLERDGRAAEVARLDERTAPPQQPAPPPEPIPPRTRSADTLDQVPFVNDDGSPTIISERQAADVSKRQTKWADIVRECK